MERATAARLIAMLGAALVWAALAVQLVLIIGVIHNQGGTAGKAAWRYFGYFTILTNILVAAVFTNAAMFPNLRSGLSAPRFEAAVAVSIVLLGLVNVIVLRQLTTLHGVQKLVDHVLHDIAPALFALFWLLRPHGRLSWVDASWFLLWPLLYCAYALLRGAVGGWYPYPFLDAARLSLPVLARNIAVLSVVFVIAAYGLVALDHHLGPRRA